MSTPPKVTSSATSTATAAAAPIPNPPSKSKSNDRDRTIMAALQLLGRSLPAAERAVIQAALAPPPRTVFRVHAETSTTSVATESVTLSANSNSDGKAGPSHAGPVQPPANSSSSASTALIIDAVNPFSPSAEAIAIVKRELDSIYQRCLLSNSASPSTAAVAGRPQLTSADSSSQQLNAAMAIAVRERDRRLKSTYVAVSSDDDANAGGQKQGSSDNKDGLAAALTYGEIDDDSIIGLICIALPYCSSTTTATSNDSKTSPVGNGSNFTFIDLGCGVGRVSLLAGLLFGFRHCVGIELLDGLYDVCKTVATAIVDTNSPASTSTTAPSARDVTFHFIRGDFLHPIAAAAYAASSAATTVQSLRVRTSAKAEADSSSPEAMAVSEYEWWSDRSVGVVFLNATCYDVAMMAAIETRCRSLPAGAIVITTTHPLPSSSPSNADITTNSHSSTAASGAGGAASARLHWEILRVIPNVSHYRSTAYIQRRLS